MTTPGTIPQDALFCDNIGHTVDDIHCCRVSNQISPACRHNFNNPEVPIFTVGCNNASCITDCQNSSLLYHSISQIDPYDGNGFAPIRRFLTCANVPTMAGYLKQEVLEPDVARFIERHVDRDEASDQALKNVSSTVTECLTQTCRASRRASSCRTPCSAVNLLINNTTPDVAGINTCLNELCTNGYDSVPYADADIIGIGVFASYIMQCVFVVLLCFGLLLFTFFTSRQPKPDPTPERMSDEPPKPAAKKPQDTIYESPTLLSKLFKQFTDFAVEFHKAQCYFSSTLQIASLSYGIFSTNMLIIFLLTPLATNGVLPIVFGYFLLFRHGRASLDITLLTIVTYALSTIVYWALYSHIIPINSQIGSDKDRFRAYQQFFFQLSSIQACGGYSALAVCPSTFVLGKGQVFDSSHNLRTLTPIIWTFSTVVLLVILLFKILAWRRERPHKHRHEELPQTETGETGTPPPEPSQQRTGLYPVVRSRLVREGVYGLAVACFLAGIGMQLSLLTIATDLNMMDRMHWSFGQIVAVTIWVPPVLAWVYGMLDMWLRPKFRPGTERE